MTTATHTLIWSSNDRMPRNARNWSCSCGARGTTYTLEQAELREAVGCEWDPGEVSTPKLVREYAELKVWFATHEVVGRVPAGGPKHQRLGLVVDELRRRGVLD